MSDAIRRQLLQRLDSLRLAGVEYLPRFDAPPPAIAPAPPSVTTLARAPAIAIAPPSAVTIAPAERVEPAPVAAAPVPAGTRSARDEVIPFDNIRRRTAEHMVQSLATSAHVYTSIEVDFERVERVRAAQRDTWKATEGFSLTYLPFIARAFADTVHEFPKVNASDDATKFLARAIVLLWYLGSWYEPVDLKDAAASPESVHAPIKQKVVSAKAYTQGLVWQIVGAHPMGYSNLQFGYWSRDPRDPNNPNDPLNTAKS